MTITRMGYIQSFTKLLNLAVELVTDAERAERQSEGDAEYTPVVWSEDGYEEAILHAIDRMMVAGPHRLDDRQIRQAKILFQRAQRFRDETV